MDISSLRERRGSSAFTVGELNNYIKSILENDRVLSAVTVRGEISNFVSHGSGHFYFSLKDDVGQIKAVMFRSSAAKLKFMPENGMKVTVHGTVSVYSQSGAYQLYANTMSPDGVGALYLMYEQLKSRLAAEGLFDAQRKKPIPRFPRSVGVITSPTGAAVRDIINVTGRRSPGTKIYLYPSLVQGEEAEANLIKALDYFEASGLVDVIIIGRGGGSIEDLWAFNGERLARKIAAMSIPVISAVGHETDFTICDFVSDLRAPTPSAAAEIAVADVKDLMIYIDMLSHRASRALVGGADMCRERLSALTSSRIFSDPSVFTEKKRAEVVALYDSAHISMKEKLAESTVEFGLNVEKLEALNPLSVLTRGFTVLEKDGRCVKHTGDVEIGDTVDVRLTDGRLSAVITEKRTEKNGK